ncbi:uncharacterized protein LOC132791151 [Drosophila nasuta]|uniref:uncharacterized protein LOC132791151 n=1 Tax=Drosophila nasuta TaxID=42062 RepID=UPI00295E7BD3|nr:uncharacterized protein LOC132791151 [Drosophila nasuta]
MFEFWIGLSIAFSIFFITSMVVMMRRRQKANKNVGYVINDTNTPVTVTSATHTAPGGIPQTHYQQGPATHFMHPVGPVTQYTPAGVPMTVYPPPPNYQQSNAYATYPAPISSQMTVQLTTVQVPQSSLNTSSPTVQQRSLNNETTAVSDPSVLPSGEEKRALHQMHSGAVESVSQI